MFEYNGQQHKVYYLEGNEYLVDANACHDDARVELQKDGTLECMYQYNDAYSALLKLEIAKDVKRRKHVASELALLQRLREAGVDNWEGYPCNPDDDWDESEEDEDETMNDIAKS